MKLRLCLFAALGLLCMFLVSPGSAQSFKPGTPIAVQLLTPLDTGTAQAGQEFSATLAQPLAVIRTVWPKGTRVKGRILDVVSSGRLSRPASITLQITQIGNSPVVTEPEQIDGKSHAGRNAGLIVGGAAAGAILGGVAGGGKGAVIGTAAGAGAGTLAAAATGKQEIVLRAETPLNFVVAGAAAAHARAPGARERPAEPRPSRRRRRRPAREGGPDGGGRDGGAPVHAPSRRGSTRSNANPAIATVDTKIGTADMMTVAAAMTTGTADMATIRSGSACFSPIAMRT